MAGAGIKKFVAGDTLTASDVNTYLMDQTVQVYDASSNRDAAFGGTDEPTLAEGMVAFLKDSNKLTIYDGSSWVEMLDTDSPPVPETGGDKLELQKDSGDAYVQITSAHDTEATTSQVIFRKADGSNASPALVDDDAVLGKIMFQGYDGNSYANGAQIRAQIDGTPADGDMPTELLFMVTPDGGSETPATALTISPDKKATFAGATQHNSTVTVGVDDTGYDVKFFGATSGSYFEWDQSADRVNIQGQMRLANITSANHDDTSLMCGSNTDITPDGHWNAHFCVDGNGYAGGISLDADAMWVGHNTTARALYFCTNETMRTNISGASGYLYHGTTGAADFPGTDGYFSVKSGDRVALAFYRQNSTTTTDLAYGLSDVGGSGTKNFQIECDGDVQNTYGNYTVLSDERLKENIVNPRDYYEDLRKLEVKNYNFCKRIKVDYDETEDGEIDLDTKQVSLVENDPASRKKLLGLVAQDAEKIFPSLVKEGEDGYKSVSLTLLIPMLLQMCQKMADKIEALEG